MKKVINKKVYNTETATLIADYSNNVPVNDFNHYSEELYRTKKGNYFLYGEGGPLSKYCESTGCNSWTGGETIIALTEPEAVRWCEEHDLVDALESEFSTYLEEA